MPGKGRQPKPGEIHGEQLEKLTGLSDRRHRQLAKLGWFPPPEGGCYAMAATIRGMFKYYQQDANDSDWGKFEKMERVRKLKLANNKTEGKLIPVEEMESLIARSHFLELDLIMRKLIRESPPVLTKLRTVPRIRKFLKALVVDIYRQKWDLIPPAWNVKPLKGKRATNDS